LEDKRKRDKWMKGARDERKKRDERSNGSKEQGP